MALVVTTSCTLDNVAQQFPCHGEGSERNVAVAILSLPSGVLLTGVPTVEEVGSSDLTITQEAVNASNKTVLGVTYAAGKVVLFHRAGGTAGRAYTLRISVNTDASPADVYVGYIRFRVDRPPARGIAR